MVEPKGTGGAHPGTNPNQFAQVGSGGSLGGGQFEQGEGQSGSLQSGGGGTTPDQAAISTETDLPSGEGQVSDSGAGGQAEQQQQEQQEQQSELDSEQQSKLRGE